MALELGIFEDAKLDAGFVQWLIDRQWPQTCRHFSRLWDYYQNPMTEVGAGRCVQAQEAGLPARITGLTATQGAVSGRSAGLVQRKEVVIENDIAWRINAMADFLLGKGVTLLSRAPEAARRRDIESILKAVIEANGGAGFFQELAVLGAVYGFVDCLIRPGDALFAGSFGPSAAHTDSGQASLASAIALELIEAPRALPILEEDDYRSIRYYVQHFVQAKNETASEDGGGFFQRLLKGRGDGSPRRRAAVTEIIGPRAWQHYEDGLLVGEGVNPLGFVPVVHIQNIAQPYFYEGVSDVEQLIGLQDELNTRLSDRASRITFQAFKMYLAKGIEGFADKPVAPGRIWATDNPEATIEEFGGDGNCPSENLHIAEIREAMDKVSGVTPVVAGVLKNKLGNLTSGVALKMTFMGMLTRNARKQFTYGQGLRQIARRVLEVLDVAGVFATTPEEREVEAVFPNPLPEDTLERLKEAQIKKELGVPTEKVLEELGYNLK